MIPPLRNSISCWTHEEALLQLVDVPALIVLAADILDTLELIRDAPGDTPTTDAPELLPMTACCPREVAVAADMEIFCDVLVEGALLRVDEPGSSLTNGAQLLPDPLWDAFLDEEATLVCLPLSPRERGPMLEEPALFEAGLAAFLVAPPFCKEGEAASPAFLLEVCMVLTS
jgi:hypothetical protein